jgi:tape measure domain-containing protein
MAGVDTRVVQIKFDNAQFESAVKTTLASLVSLNSGLKLDGASKGLDDVSAAAGRFSLAGMASSVEGIGAKFSAMSVIAVTALATIVNKAVTAGAELAKNLTLDPLKAGFAEYETGLNSVQTILANTAAAGVKLKDVNATLLELNKYSDQTIYNFGEMAKNIGTFTAAGVDLKTATAAIKGIANLAALSGSNSQQASTAMYQLSQAISAGRVSLEDWNSVVNAGMGGTVFQRALAQTAEKMGTLSKGSVKLKGDMKNVTIEGQSFRESITAKPGEESWLTSEVLTKTLSQFTGDLSDAELAAQGFSKAEIKAIQDQAAVAKAAATEVKTVTQLMGTLREAAGSGWAQTWQLIFGDFDEAKVLFTNVNNVLGGFISSSANARNKVIGDWKEMGGRTLLIDAIGNAFKALISVVTPIKDAFREIFPATTGAQLFNLTANLREFTQSLILGDDTMDKLKRTFAGVFAVFDIGIEIVKQIVKTFVSLFSSATEGSGGILDFTANVGDFLVKVRDAIVNGDGLSNIFEKIGNVLAIPIKLIKAFVGVLADAFGGSSDISGIQERFAPLGALGNVIATAWGKAVGIFDTIWSKFKEMAPAISDAFGSLMDSIGEAFSSGNYTKILDGINTGLFAALVLAFRKFASGSLFGDVNVGDGFFESIRGSFENLTGTMKAMQAQLKAKTLLEIAAAIALMTVSVVALSMIDSEKLTKALGALTIMFTQLIGAMALFAKATAAGGLLKLPATAAALILLAIAIDILVIAVTALSKLSWEELAKGLGGVTVLIGLLVLAVKGMEGQAGGMVTAGAGLLILAAAIKVLVSAVTDLSGLSWEEMAQGLTGVAVLLGALALYTKFASAEGGGLLAGAGLLLLAAAIKVMASALKDISGLSWEELAQGLVGMAGGLTVMAAALILIPPSSVLSAAAVLIVAASLSILASALEQMSQMSWEEIAKGLVVLATSLGIIAAAMAVMTTALPGAAALLIVTASLALLQPVLSAFAGMTWGEIAKGLIALAAALAVIGVAGILLAPVVPILLGLGAAIGLLGLGMLAAGAGLLLFSVALTAISVAGAAGTAAIVGIVTALLALLPQIVTAIGQTVIAFAESIAAAAPAVLKAATAMITSLLTAIATLSPKIISTLLTLLTDMLTQFADAVPKMVAAGLKILTGFLQGIADNIGKVVTTATNVIVNFLDGISKNLPRIVDSGVKLIISFVNGLADSIRNNQAAMQAAGANLADAIIDGMVKGLANGASAVVSAAKNAASAALNAAKDFLGINSPSKEFEKLGKFSTQGMANGLDKTSDIVAESAKNVGKDAILAMQKSISGMDQLIADSVDAQPTIRPVMDLTDVQKGSSKLGSLIPSSSALSVNANTTYAQARAARRTYDANQQVAEIAAATASEVRPIQFVQNNTSPKALSHAEIYRQTRNQLSQTKGALTK